VVTFFQMRKSTAPLAMPALGRHPHRQSLRGQISMRADLGLLMSYRIPAFCKNAS